MDDDVSLFYFIHSAAIYYFPLPLYHRDRFVIGLRLSLGRARGRKRRLAGAERTNSVTPMASEKSVSPPTPTETRPKPARA